MKNWKKNVEQIKANFWRTTKRLRGHKTKKIRSIRDNKRKTNKEEILEIWSNRNIEDDNENHTSKEQSKHGNEDENI